MFMSLVDVGRGDVPWLTPLSTSAHNTHNTNVTILTDIFLFLQLYIQFI